MTTRESLQARIQKEIGELTRSITGLLEDFRTLQRPLMESHEQVPKATCQLDKINEQTEEVTHRMLDIVENITRREEEIINGIEKIRRVASSGQVRAVEKLAVRMSEQASQNLNDAYMIMESLQFQDITAQQIDHAASILENVESKLRRILKTVGAEDCVFAETAPSHRKVRAFDPHADFTDRKANQADIDSLFEQKQK